MFRLALLLLPLAVGRLRTSAQNAKQRLIHLALAAGLGLLALGFALATVTALVAREIGLIAALGLMTALAALAAIVVVVVLRVGERRRRTRAGPLSRVPASAYSSAFARALAGARRPRAGRGIGLGLLALGALLFVLGAGGDDDD